MKKFQLDALFFPASSGVGLSARPGYPTVIVPFAMVPNDPTPPFPEGFNAKPQPYGVSFVGLACSEPRLLALAYAFEQATKKRVPPAVGSVTSIDAAVSALARGCDLLAASR